MTLRIDATHDGPRLALRLVGRIRCENLGDLKHEIAGRGRSVVLDLDEVTIVDVEVVRFLGDAEAAGVELRRCPTFIREWIQRERDVARANGHGPQ